MQHFFAVGKQQRVSHIEKECFNGHESSVLFSEA
jgi:hypothetical protein